MLVEVYHKGQALRACQLAPLPVIALCFLHMDKDVIFQLLAPSSCCHAASVIRDPLSGTLSQKDPCSINCLSHGIFHFVFNFSDGLDVNTKTVSDFDS